MGKIVKYCVSCDEGFAEKFGFCPTCGAQLQSFEMKPVPGDTPAETIEPPVAEEAISVEPYAAAQYEEATPTSFESAPAEPEIIAETSAGSEIEDAASEIEEPQLEDVVEVQASEASSAPPAETHYPAYSSPDRGYYGKDDAYYVTVIQENNQKQRNVLLLGAAVLMVALTFGGTVYSLFHKDLQVGAITDGELYAFVPIVDDTPMEIEEQKKKNKDEGGGGGGGGREEETPTSQGRLASQMEKPIIRPDVSIDQKNFDLTYQAATQGKNQYPPTDQKYGNPGSKYDKLSNGQGVGGGMGNGFGNGQGDGRGGGNGNGIGNGSGNGIGDGNGDGKGNGDNGDRNNDTPPPPTGVTQSVKIISKPRANYTDAARQNNIQGSVTLRITFLASGQIGGISAVNSLPYGLTEQAIAAARSIRFEPAKRNGVPYTKQMTIQYGFTIY